MYAQAENAAPGSWKGLTRQRRRATVWRTWATTEWKRAGPSDSLRVWPRWCGPQPRWTPCRSRHGCEWFSLARPSGAYVPRSATVCRSATPASPARRTSRAPWACATQQCPPRLPGLQTWGNSQPDAYQYPALLVGAVLPEPECVEIGGCSPVAPHGSGRRSGDRRSLRAAARGPRLCARCPQPERRSGFRTETPCLVLAARHWKRAPTNGREVISYGLG